MNKTGFARVCLLTMLLWVATICSAEALAVPFDPSSRLVIMLMLDGFRPDYITMYAPPNLQRLVAEGAWVAEARSVFPAMTTPNQTSFVTGSLPARTGIPNNSRYDRQQDRIISPLRDNRTPTIAETLAKAGWYTASVNHFMLQNRGVLRYVQGDMDDMINLLQTDRPGLLVYYNANTDSAGHQYGPFQPGTRAAVLAADAEIGKLLAALDKLGLTKQTTIAVASDHGMSLNDGVGIQPDLMRLLITSGLRFAGVNQDIRPDTDMVYIASGSAFLYWRNGRKTPEREAQLMKILASLEGADVYIADDIRAAGADPERLGDIAIVPRPGRALISGGGTGGGHGTPQESQSMILLWGAGIKPGVIVPKASITDIVPTLLTLARVDIPATVDGRPLEQALVRTSWKARLGVSGDYAVKDVAASDMGLIDVPAHAADGNTATNWQASVNAFTPAYIAFDYGMNKVVGSVQIVSGSSAGAAPKECALEVSSDGVQYTTMFEGELPLLDDGAAYTIRLDKPVDARFLRFTIRSSWNDRSVEIAEIRVWASGDAQ